jgi:hypothetical protein
MKDYICDYCKEKLDFRTNPLEHLSVCKAAPKTLGSTLTKMSDTLTNPKPTLTSTLTERDGTLTPQQRWNKAHKEKVNEYQRNLMRERRKKEK